MNVHMEPRDSGGYYNPGNYFPLAPNTRYFWASEYCLSNMTKFIVELEIMQIKPWWLVQCIYQVLRDGVMRGLSYQATLILYQDYKLSYGPLNPYSHRHLIA